MKLYQTEILASQKQGDVYHLLALGEPDLARLAKPGQFVYLKGGEGLDPLLPRPLSIHRIDRQEGTIHLLFQIKGKGTKALAELSSGARLTILGPLGNGFSLAEKGRKVVLVGGGIGTAPLLALAEELANKGCNLRVILGYKDQDSMVAYKSFAQVTPELLVATEDGSFGEPGRVTDLLKRLLSEEKTDQVYACGPEPMLQAVQEIVESQRIDCQLSLEARMGCGIGACMACVCGVKVKDEQLGYRKVCNEGPVFDSGEVVFGA